MKKAPDTQNPTAAVIARDLFAVRGCKVKSSHVRILPTAPGDSFQGAAGA